MNPALWWQQLGLVAAGGALGAMLRFWLGGLLLGSPLVLALAGTPAALFYLLFWFYLWAMYKEFYIGARLQNFPLL